MKHRQQVLHNLTWRTLPAHRLVWTSRLAGFPIRICKRTYPSSIGLLTTCSEWLRIKKYRFWHRVAAAYTLQFQIDLDNTGCGAGSERHDAQWALDNERLQRVRTKAFQFGARLFTRFQDAISFPGFNFHYARSLLSYHHRSYFVRSRTLRIRSSFWSSKMRSPLW